MDKNEQIIRKELVAALEGRNAHISLEAAIKDFPVKLAAKKLLNLDHTTWQLVYHLWIAQWDILQFCTKPGHKSPPYPSGYWPAASGPKTADEWETTLKKFHSDLEEMKSLVKDSNSELFTPFGHGNGQTLFREVLVLAKHNSYHIGQLVDMRMLLGVPVRDW